MSCCPILPKQPVIAKLIFFSLLNKTYNYNNNKNNYSPNRNILNELFKFMLVFKNEGKTKKNTAIRKIADIISCIAIDY